MRKVVSVSKFNVLAALCAVGIAATPLAAAPILVAAKSDASALVVIGAAEDTAGAAIKAFVFSELGGWVVLSLGAGAIVILSRRRRKVSTD
jgi:hypothetical protein